MSAIPSSRCHVSAKVSRPHAGKDREHGNELLAGIEHAI
jgi:hypothetical protein